MLLSALSSDPCQSRLALAKWQNLISLSLRNDHPRVSSYLKSRLKNLSSPSLTNMEIHDCGHFRIICLNLVSLASNQAKQDLAFKWQNVVRNFSFSFNP